jgi:predicted RNA-binding protein with PIN domain
MQPKLVILDAYNVILRSDRLKPGPTRTLRESREKLVNLLSWMMGANDVRFLVVFDGADGGGPDENSGRVQVQFSRPPEKADDLIRRIVEKRVGGEETITVVTSDLEVARHARAMGADVSIADLFLASAFPPAKEAGGAENAEGEAEKPVSLSKREIEEWAELFKSRQGKGEPGPDET